MPGSRSRPPALVLGGGLIGLSVAEALARRGVPVRVLERREQVGLEASSAAAGMLSPWDEVEGPGPFLDLLLRGLARFPETIRRLSQLSGVDLQYREAGMLGLAPTPADAQELQRRWAWQRLAGVPVERVPAARIRTLEPAADRPLQDALWWPRVAQVNPARLAQAYRIALEKAGGEVLTCAEVEGIEREAGRMRGVRLKGGAFLKAETAVLCGGAWTGVQASHGLPFEIPVFPIKGQMLAFTCDRPLVQRILKGPGGYLVQRDEKTLLAGSTLERSGFDKAATPEGERRIRRAVGQITSVLEGRPVCLAWAGLRPATPDGLPILSETPVQGLFAASGHFRNGILLATCTGELMAEWIVGGAPSWNLTPFKLSRFAKPGGSEDSGTSQGQTA